MLIANWIRHGLQIRAIVYEKVLSHPSDRVANPRDRLRESFVTSERSSHNKIFKDELVTNNSFENFTAQLNKIFNKYEINNCKRRSHFLAQIFVETQNFSKTIESDNEYTPNYDPLRGRGFIHLTDNANYINYTKFKKEVYKLDIDFETNYSLISTNLEYAADASGWYWRYGSSYGDINKIAESKSIKEVTKAVQGGDRALKAREDAYNLLIKIFKQ